MLIISHKYTPVTQCVLRVAFLKAAAIHHLNYSEQGSEHTIYNIFPIHQ